MNFKKGLRAIGKDLKVLGSKISEAAKEQAERQREKKQVYKDAYDEEEKVLLKEKAKQDAKRKVFGDETKAGESKEVKFIIGYGKDAKEIR